jgi:prophage maintenance system killer protein
MKNYADIFHHAATLHQEIITSIVFLFANGSKGIVIPE